MDSLSLEIQTNTDHKADATLAQASTRQNLSQRPRPGLHPPTRVRHRPLADRLLGHSPHLLPHEASMIHAVYGRGVSVGELATAMKLSTRRLRRRIEALVHRLESPTFSMVLAQRDVWPPRLRQVATELFILGRNMRTVARMTGLSYGQVRRQRDALVTMANTWQATRMARLGGPTIGAAIGEEP